MKYLIVFHSWFVHSRGFDVVHITAESRTDAEAKAKASAFDRSRDFCSAAYVVLDVCQCSECIAPPRYRRLTWRERFFGWAYL